MNAGMKQFLSFRSTLLLNKIGTFYGTVFSDKALTNLRSEYAGARFIDSCNTMGQKAFSRIGNTAKAVGSSFKQATTTISAAAKRFSNAFFKGSSRKEIIKRPGVAEKYFDDDELQQLRTIYGVDTSKMTETTAKGRRRIITPTTSTKKVIKDIGKKSVSLRESSKKAINNTITSTKEYIDHLKNYKQQKETDSFDTQSKNFTKETTFIDLNLSESDKQTIAYALNETFNKNFNDSLHLAFADSTSKAQQLFTDITQDLLISDNSDQTYQFNAIISQIKEIETLIGKTNENGLLKLVGDICEFQCGNKGNKGCRPK
jgi:hypothetical protein